MNITLRICIVTSCHLGSRFTAFSPGYLCSRGPKNLGFLSFSSDLIVLPHAAGSFLTRIFRGSDQNLSGMAGSARVQKCIQKFQLLSSVARPRPRFIGAPARPCARLDRAPGPPRAQPSHALQPLLPARWWLWLSTGQMCALHDGPVTRGILAAGNSEACYRHN